MKLRVAVAAIRLQLRIMSRSPDYFVIFATTPLVTVVLLVISRNAGRPNLAAVAVLAPVIMAIWAMAINVSGDIIDVERSQGTLELLVASPAELAVVVMARAFTVSVTSLLALLESWLVAEVFFGVEVRIFHTELFAVTLASTVLATAGWATAMSAIFVLARSARVFQNALSYPFYVLGGAVVPLALLPLYLSLPGRLVYLSWCSDLLRASTQPGDVSSPWLRVLVIVALGAVGFALGRLLIERALQQARTVASLGFA